MANLTTQVVGQAGTVESTVAAAGGGDRFTPGDNVWLEVTNGGGSPINVTIDSKVPSNYGTDADLVVSVTNGTTRKIGPLPAPRFSSPTDGLGDISYSAVTSVTVAVWRI